MIHEKTFEELYDTDRRIVARKFPKSEYGVYEAKRKTASTLYYNALERLGNTMLGDKDQANPYLIYKALRAMGDM